MRDSSTEDGIGTDEAGRFWEAHYADRGDVWRGTPNPLLADTARQLTPGRALDLGCGEGGDSVWLARQGWRVTAVDIASTALARTARHAEEAGVGGRVTTERHDLATGFPDGTFDLVSAQYLHTPFDLPRERVLHRAAQALAPSGLLLVVDHGSTRPWAWNTDPDQHYPTPAETYATFALDPSVFTPERLEQPQRTATGPGGRQALVTDTVVAVRRAR
ncbi:class I SAM-dependent methyltransferase [Streptomyces sp. 549]|uniref:class I SAM-dependent methyltransferase n=1 Tax=Streptomyces sp. 549 TaxID=3049076 RepID=UPI0024C2F5F0|nr:class I SAM-dependent methyltransferase [Streptomyces sp. 549]MDK1473322.1 class I SAM-dependent methyltransferase [Streptomyces sp. 549]